MLTGERRAVAGLVLVVLGLALGAVGHLAGAPRIGDRLWYATTAAALVPVTFAVARTTARGRLGVDAIALVAMAGALALGEALAGAVIAVMLTGGGAAEALAGRRARRELALLIERAPRVAHRRMGDEIVEVSVAELVAGDRLVIRPGEVVPVDGRVHGGAAVLDESALTGESLPEVREPGAHLASGVSNAGEAFEMVATCGAAESTYAAIVRLVRAAESERAPFVRLADRYAAAFVPLTLAAAGAAWFLSGDPVRALAVTVVATPCPLILAAPIALVCGVSRAAKLGVIVKGAGVIERLGSAATVLFDKTGTLTVGTPEVREVRGIGTFGGDEALRLAASLEQLSPHVTAEALVHGAQARGLVLSLPTGVTEDPGHGIVGTVDGQRVAVGGRDYLAGLGVPLGPHPAGPARNGRGTVLVAVDGRLRATITTADPLRPDAARLVRSLREAGIGHLAMVTGDSAEVADPLGRELGVDRVYSGCRPEDKVAVVRAATAAAGGLPVVMVGDGINDAPALAVADVGVALGAVTGATVASETADVVLTVDRVERVADALRISRRAMHIARQSVLVGMGLSIVAMGVAAAGYLPPVQGALLQEVIDVGVILNALRALGDRT